MSELSILVDESGDFGDVVERPAYYLVTFVLHEQDKCIEDQIRNLEERTKNAGFDIDYIHTGPVIRREEIFTSYSIDERRQLLYNMLDFTRKCEIKSLTIAINRNECKTGTELKKQLNKKIDKEFQQYLSYFLTFDKVIVYYDNGQRELKDILDLIFTNLFNNIEFRSARPQKYRLLQVADFICSLELLRIKRAENRLSKSESKFFYKPNELKKTFLKAIDKKAFKL